MSIEGLFIAGFIKSYRARFGNNGDALFVAEVEHFLTVRIMRGAERICAEHFHKGYILHVERLVNSPAVGFAVLVLAEALEVKRLAVNEEFSVLYFSAANAEFLRIRIVFIAYLRGVKICPTGLPELGVFYCKRLAAIASGYFCSLGVYNNCLRAPAVGEVGVYGNGRVVPLNFGCNADVLYILLFGSVNAHAAVNSAVVEKVKIRVILRLNLRIPDAFKIGKSAAEHRAVILVPYGKGFRIHAVVNRYC